jgi:acetone carboxylase gamma subunit
MSYSGMRFVDKLHTDYNPCLTPVWGLLTSYTQTRIHVLLWYEVCWQVTRRLQSMSYSGMRFVDKIHTNYNPCLTPVWCSLTSYTQTTIHVLLWYEVCWQVTHRLQSMSYSIMRFIDKLHTYYIPCLTLVWGLLESYTHITIHVLLRYEVCRQVTHRLQSISYSGMKFVDKLHTDYNPCLTLVWGLLTSYTQTTIYVLLHYEVRWQVTHRLQSMFYSDMRSVDKLQTDYNSCLTPVWGSLTSYTQITIYVLCNLSTNLIME